MADKSIPDLNEATQLFDNGLMVVYQSGETKKMQGQALKQYVQAVADVDAAKDAADRAQAAAATIESKVTRAETASASAESFAGEASTASGAAQTAKNDAENAAYRAEAALADVVTPDLKIGTVTTLAAGSNATVTRRAGSPNSAPVFDFGIPKGTDGSGAVKSVNGKTGAVVLSSGDVGARPNTWMPTAEQVGALPSSTHIPSDYTDSMARDQARYAMNRSTDISAADTNYTTFMARGEAIFESAESATSALQNAANGTIAWVLKT